MLSPVFLVPYLVRKKVVPSWVLPIYIISFLCCALGWEMWFTYGWVDGDAVDLRRSAALTAAIPIHINWLMNSLADAGSICLPGLWLMWRFTGRNTDIFRKWDWSAFLILFVWAMGQNIFVEMFLYHDQLAEGKPLSWAPLAPTGPWYNPVLFEFRDRTITLQSQMPWLFMAPGLYWLVIGYLKKNES